MQRYEDKKTLIISWVFAFCFFTLSMFIYDSISQSNQLLEQELEHKYSDMLRLKNLLASSDTIEDKYSNLSIKRKNVDEDILKYLEAELVASSLKLIDIRKDDEEFDEKDYVKLRLTGDLAQFMEFAYRLSDSAALLKIDSYEIARENENLLNIKLSLVQHVL